MKYFYKILNLKKLILFWEKFFLSKKLEFFSGKVVVNYHLADIKKFQFKKISLLNSRYFPGIYEWICLIPGRLPRMTMAI